MGAISFPSFGIELNPDRIAFTLFGKDVYWYGVIIAAGFILAVLYGMKRAKTVGLTDDNILDMLFAAVPAAIVCARLYYCIFYWDFYKENPITVLYIWEGGLAIYGGVIGAVAAVTIFCKIKKLPLGPMLDVGGLGLLIGQTIGRWGNFINREAHGAVTDSFLKMGIANSAGEVTYYHPTFLYESLWNLVGFIVLHFYLKRRKFDGEIFAWYVAWYGLGRAWIEGLRTDSLYLFNTGIRVSQLLAVASCLAAIAFILYIYISAKPQMDDLYVNRKTAEQEKESENPQ